jgi:hypothetical protein
VSKLPKPLGHVGASATMHARSKATSAPDASKTSSAIERRQHPRYRFSEPMKVRCQDGACFDGISVEISESGMSAMISGVLKPGDVVRLQPVTGVVAEAVVRHKLGMLYGFEFVELAREEARKIAERCRKCEPWRSNARTI